jgi:hypothetical protein
MGKDGGDGKGRQALTAYCKQCGGLLPEEYRVAPDKPCPVCGSTARHYEVRIEEKVQVEDMLEWKACPAKGRSWFSWGYTRLVAQRSLGGALAYVKRIVDRRTDRYVETVTMRDTGEVIHHCDEPLSQHQGHGSARQTPK